jgi:predicted HAD superfamily phosphohydrolase YqeG
LQYPKLAPTDGVNDRPIFVDIDGTLTNDPERYGEAMPERCAWIQHLIDEGFKIVIWSATGTQYALDFVERNGITGALAVLGKPEVCIDDKITVRKEGLTVLLPEEIFG